MAKQATCYQSMVNRIKGANSPAQVDKAINLIDKLYELGHLTAKELQRLDCKAIDRLNTLGV